MFEPVLVIFASPLAMFAWVLCDLHRNREPAAEEAPVAGGPAPAAWQSSISAPA